MTIPPQDLRNIFAELLIEAAEKRERRDHIAAIKKRLKDEKKEGIDWSQLRALAVAHDADQNPREGDTKEHVAELIEKRGYAEAYADIVLRVHVPEHIQSRRSSSLDAVSLAGGRTGQTPMRAGCDDNAPAKEATNNDGVGNADAVNKSPGSEKAPNQRPSRQGISPSPPLSVVDKDIGRTDADPGEPNSNPAPSLPHPQTKEASGEAASITPPSSLSGAASTIPSDDRFNDIRGTFLDRTAELRA